MIDGGALLTSLNHHFFFLPAFSLLMVFITLRFLLLPIVTAFSTTCWWLIVGLAASGYGAVILATTAWTLWATGRAPVNGLTSVTFVTLTSPMIVFKGLLHTVQGVLNRVWVSIWQTHTFLTGKTSSLDNLSSLQATSTWGLMHVHLNSKLSTWHVNDSTTLCITMSSSEDWQFLI